MPFTSITKPSVGDATRKALIDTVIDNQAYLNGQVDLAVPGIPNGSFENDTDSDGIPDGWDRTLYTGGTFSLITSDDQQGAYCISMTSPGGSGNGGAYVDMEDFFEVNPLSPVVLQWLHKSSAAGIHNSVLILWYKDDKTASTTTSTTLYDSTSNPTSWTLQSGAAKPPSDARFAKVRIIGAEDDNTTAGIAYWDGVKLGPINKSTPYAYTADGTHTVSAGCYAIRVQAWGSGGAGGSSTGGGGGEYAEDFFTLADGDFTEGEGLTVAMTGATTATSLTNSGGTILTADYGTSGGGGGAGGSGSSNAVAISGTAGSSGFGGHAPMGGTGNTGAGPGGFPGGGGGPTSGAAGAPLMMITEYL